MFNIGDLVTINKKGNRHYTITKEGSVGVIAAQTDTGHYLVKFTYIPEKYLEGYIHVPNVHSYLILYECLDHLASAVGEVKVSSVIRKIRDMEKRFQKRNKDIVYESFI